MAIKFLNQLSDIESFSLFSANLNELSYLLCVELLYCGQIAIPNAEKYFNVDYRDNEKLITLLSPQIEFYENRLIKSVEMGEVKASFIIRDVETGKIIPHQTLISSSEFGKFLKIYDLFDLIAYDSDYPIMTRWEFEGDLQLEVQDLIALRKSLYHLKHERELFEKTKQDLELTPTKIDLIIKENVELQIKLASGEGVYIKEDKPLINKERETLLVIIAALAKESSIAIDKTSKSAELIASLTQLLGSPIGATTIETHLKKIPHALESRAK